MDKDVYNSLATRYMFNYKCIYMYHWYTLPALLYKLDKFIFFNFKVVKKDRVYSNPTTKKKKTKFYKCQMNMF